MSRGRGSRILKAPTLKLHSSRYPRRAPVFDQTGKFEAWISGSASNERSAVAVRIREIATGEIATCAFPSAGHSTSQRAMLAALLLVFEIIPAAATVTVHTKSKYAYDCARRLEEYKSQGWRGASGCLANEDLLDDLYLTQRSRSLSSSVLMVGQSERENIRIIDQLRNLARSHLG